MTEMVRKILFLSLLVGWLGTTSGQDGCKPDFTSIFVQNSVGQAKVVTVHWAITNEIECSQSDPSFHYDVRVGTCREDTDPDFSNSCDSTVSSTVASFEISSSEVMPMLQCSVQYPPLVIAVNTSRCLDCYSFFYLSSVNNTMPMSVNIAEGNNSVKISLSLGCTSPLVCIGGQYNNCYGTSLLPNDHKYDESQRLLCISNITESFNETVYTIVCDANPCRGNENYPMNEVILNIQLLVYNDSTPTSSSPSHGYINKPLIIYIEVTVAIIVGVLLLVYCSHRR